MDDWIGGRNERKKAIIKTMSDITDALIFEGHQSFCGPPLSNSSCNSSVRSSINSSTSPSRSSVFSERLHFIPGTPLLRCECRNESWRLAHHPGRQLFLDVPNIKAQELNSSICANAVKKSRLLTSEKFVIS